MRYDQQAEEGAGGHDISPHSIASRYEISLQIADASPRDNSINSRARWLRMPAILINRAETAAERRPTSSQTGGWVRCCIPEVGCSLAAAIKPVPFTRVVE